MDLNTILNLMSMYHLTADELLLIYLTILGQDEENHIEYFQKWFNGGGSERLKSLFESLKEKGIIHKDYNPKMYNPNDIEFNKTFINSFIKHSGIMGNELFEAYPSFLNINGKYAPLKDVSKRFATLNDFYCFYGTQIGNNPKVHKEVMDILKWAKENGHITFGILSFVISNQWKMLKELRDNPEVAPICQTSIFTDD